MAAQQILTSLGWSDHAIRSALNSIMAREKRTAEDVANVLGLVLAVGVAPVVEEFVFRGMLFRGLRRRMRFWPAAILSAALFTGLHFYIVGAPMIFIMGLVSALAVERHGGLVPSVAMHAVWNMRILVILLARQ